MMFQHSWKISDVLELVYKIKPRMIFKHENQRGRLFCSSIAIDQSPSCRWALSVNILGITLPK